MLSVLSPLTFHVHNHTIIHNHDFPTKMAHLSLALQLRGQRRPFFWSTNAFASVLPVRPIVI
jgi:hypothetical protein